MAQEKTTEVASVHDEKGHDAEWVGNGTTTLDSNATSRGGQLEVIRHCAKPLTRLLILRND
jgi:hypothetical protein